ncbi:transketolase family protein [Harryflintia acetispora]|uniref:transketolase family protein n=1 Tax=Harryflintia acetispora TaxID=1849041 RepID=UPI0018989049|nr:transketolase C-terminal domain-containing protein [Harryflintia acetispora]
MVYDENEIKMFGDQSAKNIIGIALKYARKSNPAIYVVYADVGKRFGIGDGDNLPLDSCVEVGIAEQNMIGVAAGMCHEGLSVYALSYAPFISGRVFDQIKANAGEMQLPIRLIGAASGLSAGDLGPLLTCIDDTAMMRTIPNMTIVSPADCFEIVKTFEALNIYNGPAYIRITGKNKVPCIYQKDYKFEIGKSIVLREGRDIVIIAAGSSVYHSLKAAEILEKEGLSCEVINMHTIKPLDKDMISTLHDRRLIVTVEEHNVIGGLGGAVAEVLSQYVEHPPLLRLGIDDAYYYADTYQNLLSKSGLTEDKIADSILKMTRRK